MTFIIFFTTRAFGISLCMHMKQGQYRIHFQIPQDWSTNPAIYNYPATYINFVENFSSLISLMVSETGKFNRSYFPYHDSSGHLF